jgi:hypothetical protein
VILQQSYGAPTVASSGVVIATAIELSDAYESMGVLLVREVASKTSGVAGDGCMIPEVPQPKSMPAMPGDMGNVRRRRALAAATALANALEGKV